VVNSFLIKSNSNHKNMIANQNKTTRIVNAKHAVQSIRNGMALLCLFALSCLPGLAQDLGVSQSGAPQPVGVSTNLTYTITVTNSDIAMAATTVTLADTLDTKVTYVSDTGGGVVVGNVLTCSLGTIPAAGSTNITVVVSTACGSIGQVTNMVVVLEAGIDVNPADNTNSIVNTVADLTPPGIVCSGNVTNECTGAGGATVTYSAATVTDICGDANAPVCNPPSCNTFPIGNTTVLCTVSDQAGNNNSCSFLVVVSGPVSATALTSITNCPGTTATFGPTVPSGAGPFTYSWTKNGTVIPGANSDTYSINLPVAPSSVVGTNAGTYCVIVAGACTTVTNCATLTVPGLILVCSPNLTNQCTSPSGGNVNFTVTVTNACDATASFSCTTNGVPVAPGALFSFGTTTVSCTANDVFLNTNTCSFTVTVRDALPPTITSCAPNQTICPTNLAGVAAVPDFTAGVAVSDSCDSWVVSQSPTNGTIVSSGTTNIVLTVRDANNNTNTCTAILVVLTNTSASALASITNCLGTAASFTTTASGSGPFIYTWTKDGVTNGSVTGNTYSIGSVGAADGGTYCVIVQGACTLATNCATLTLTTAPLITTQPQSQATPMGNGAVFTVAATPATTVGYQWTSNGVNLVNGPNVVGATTASLAISNVTLAMSGTAYSVVVSNCVAMVTSTPPVILTVTPVSGISFDFDTPGQYTNTSYNIGNGLATYSIGNNYWMNNVLPTVPFEATTGGVTTSGVASGAIDFLNQNTTDETSTCLAQTFDFSLSNKTLIASVMMKVKLSSPWASNGRAIQLGFGFATNVNNAWQGGLNGNAGQGFMTAILNSAVSNSASSISYSLHAQTKGTNSGTIEIAPVGLTNALTVGNWYKLVATFVNTKGPGVLASNYTVAATLQDMGTAGTNAGAIVLTMPAQTQQNVDVVSAKNLLLSLRSVENTGVDLLDNIYVQTTTGPAFFVTPPASQTVGVGQRATFKAYVDGDGPYSYQWNKNGVPISGARQWQYTTPSLASADNTASFTCSVTTSNLPPQVPVTVTSAPAIIIIAPGTLAVVSVGSIDGFSVGLRFNQAVDPVTAAVAANYSINGGPAYQVSVRPDLKSVVLIPSPSFSGAFAVTVSNVKDVNGVAISGPGASASGYVAGLIGIDVNPSVAVPIGQNFSFASNSFELSGGGVDIWNNADSYRYVYRTNAGDFDIQVRIPYIDIVRSSSKAGFVARDSLDPSCPMVCAAVDPPLPARNFYEGTTRATYNIAAVSWGNTTAASFPDAWLRFRRVANTFHRYSSTNGVNWTYDGQVSQKLQDTVLLGLGACAVLNVAGQPVRANLDNFGNFPGYTGATIGLLASPTNATVASGASGTIFMSANITNAPLYELSFIWQRTNSAVGGWTNMFVAGTTNNFFSTGPMYDEDNGALYRAILTAPGVASVTSGVAMVTVADAPNPVLTSVQIRDIAPPLISFQLLLTFSENMTMASATNLANYSVTNGSGVSMGVASAALLSGDPKTVVLTTISPLITGNYGVVVNNVKDANNISVPANSTLNFVQRITSPLAPIIQEWYLNGTGGGSIRDLLLDVRGRYAGTGSTNYTGANPDYTTYSNLFGVNALGAVPSSFDNYSVRSYTYFVPTNTGPYIFFLRGDDYLEFFMNTNSVGSTNVADYVVGVSNVLGDNTFNFHTNNSGVTQQPYFGMDNRAVTKFLGGGTNVGLIVKPVIGATVVNGIRFTTANDAQERDPSMFTLEGSTAADPRFGPWVQIAVGSTGLINSNVNNARLTTAPDVVFTNLTGAFTNTTFYTSYRILFPGLRSTNSAGAYSANQLCQVGEIALLGTNGVSNTPFKIIPSGAVVQIAMTAANAAFVPVSSFTNFLTAGQKYYMECRFKEQTGGDACAVALRTGSNTNVPSTFEAIPASLCSFPADLAVPQTVVAEIYRGAIGQTIVAGGSFTSGSTLVDMTNAFLSFNATNRLPDTLCYRPCFGFATNLVDTLMNNYIGRIYSYFTPPSNGLYHFYMRSDDSSQLFMNTNAVNSRDPAGMVSLGAINAFTSAFVSEAQNVPLFATNLYYIEGRWKDGTGGDGIQVAVRAQSDAGVPVAGEGIPPSMLRYPTNAVPVRSSKLRLLSSLTPLNPVVSDGQTVTFVGGALDGDLGGGITYIWLKNGQQVFANGGSTFTTQPLSPSDNGAVFTLRITNLFDSVEQSSTVTVNPDATRPVLLSSVGSQYNDRITLRFSEASGLDPISARFIPNYAIPGLTVTNVLLDNTRTVVMLQTTPQTPGTHYSLTVGGVKDGSFEQNVIATTNVTVSGWAFGGTGTFIELWTNIGVGVSSLNGLTNDQRYGFNTTDTNGYGASFGFGTTATLTINAGINDFLGTVFTGNGLEAYGCRISGLFVAPSNGYYRFYLASDDASALFMNTNAVNSEAPALRQQIINVASSGLSYTNPLSVSTQLFLTLGQRYYMETLLKEGTGGDYVHATFRSTDASGNLIDPLGPPINNTVAETIPGSMFVPPGNPDALSVAQGLPGSTNVLQNRLMTLAPTLNPPSAAKIAQVQWQRSTDNTCTTFTNIPGANSVTYSQYVDMPDEGFCFRVGLALPGSNFTNTTTLHVIPDSVAPHIISAGCIDPYHVGVQFDERVDFVHGAGDNQSYFFTDTDFNLLGVFDFIVTRTNDGGVSAVLSVNMVESAPLVPGKTYYLACFDFADLAGNPNGYDGGDPTGVTAPFTVMNLFAQDIGTPTPPAVPGAGGYNYGAVPAYPVNPFPSTNGGFDVLANGWDIWNGIDGFHFDWLNRPMVGNFDLKVRVQRLDGADQWSKAGLMIRSSTNANARWIYMINTPATTPVNGQLPNNFSSLQWRDFDGASAAPNQGNSNGVPPVAYPNAWVRLQRVGNVFYGYQSSNDVDWVLIGSRDTAATGFPFPESMVFGLCTVSHDQIVADNISRNAYVEYRDLHIPNELPTITAQPGPASQRVIVHSAVSYSVTATNPANSGPLVYQWLKNGVPIPTATNASLTLTDLKVVDSGTYTVTPANNGGGTPSVALVLVVTNILPVVAPESLIATQGLAYTFSAAYLLGNDFDPDTDTLTLVSVSGVGINSPQIATNFNQGILTGSTLYGGAPTGGVWLAAGGVGGSGGLQINSGIGSTAGSYIIDEITPGNPVNSFIVSFNLRIGDGSAEPADGMSVNFANDLPNTATTPLAAEQGAGNGFTFAIDDYRFLPVPTIGASAATANGGTANTSGMKIIYHGNNIAVQQCPTFASGTFVPVTISVSDSGVATVMVSGTNVFGDVTLPGYTPTTGRFGFYGRAGGSFEAHTIDDLSITLNPHQQTALGGSVSLNNGIVTYIAPTNSCGLDTFYYTISDGQLGGTVIDHVDIVVYPTNNTVPVIASCPSDRVVPVGANCQGTLPDLTGDLIVVDQCTGVVKTQDPAAGTATGGSGNVTTVTLTASNITGLTATCQMFVTNIDLTAPTIGCPADIVAECTGNGANISYSVSSSDNCSTPIVNCTPVPSGGHFPLGTNTVNCTSTDVAGNVGSCSFKVIVLDTTAPAVTCPNITAECTGTGEANVSFAPVVVEACDPSPTVICTPPSGSTFGFGPTTVNCTVYDASLNTNTCTFTVTVRDTTAPTFTCPANQALDCTGVDGAVATYTTPTATDTCDASPIVSCSPDSGSTFPVGTNTVTCIAHDASLNTNMCTFKITVTDAAGAPTMSIVRSGSNVIISWPATCTTYNLEKATSLPNWGPSGATVVLVSGTYQATIAETGTAFYRLRKP